MKSKNVPPLISENFESMNLKKADFGRRVGAFFIDYFIYAISMAILSHFIDISIRGRTLPATLIIMFFYFCLRDINGGASIGKRFLKIVVRLSDNPKLKPDQYKLFLRNLLTLIWPIELIAFLIKKRKLGDYLAKTDVYDVSKESNK